MRLSLSFLFSLFYLTTIAAQSDDEEWNNFKQVNKKNFTDAAEESRRKGIYLENKKFIEEHNKKYEAGESTYKLKINHLAHLSYEEYYGYMHLAKEPAVATRKVEGDPFVKPDGAKSPDCINWKDKGAVTDARDQNLEKCGACWAHAGAAVIEGQIFIKKGKLEYVSVQAIIDCSVPYGTTGCTGGSAGHAFQYFIDQEGDIPKETEYPYKALRDKCTYKLKDQKEKPDNALGYIVSGDEEEIKIAVSTIGPLASTVYASGKDFRFYSEGIYYESDCDGKDSDHAVVIVGYCTDSQKRDYWLVKNSFGTDWGENGFFKVYRTKDKSCGVGSIQSYPILKDVKWI